MTVNPDQVEISAALADGVPVTLLASPLLRQFGAQFLGGEAGALTLAFDAPAEYVQGNGVVGGGAVSTVLDVGMALAVLSAIEPGSTCSTLSMTVNFLSALRQPHVTVDACIDRAGRRAAFASATATDADGRAVATASSSLLLH
jgi:uncharacterized protein (TIGR00369 family)